MPTNLPAEWYKKKEEFDNAKGEEKIKKLEELIALTPYHKGTENLRADLRRKLAKLKRQLEAQKSQRKGRSYTITKEGDARVSIIGFPNNIFLQVMKLSLRILLFYILICYIIMVL